MCLGRRDDRELGGDRGVSGFRPGIVGDDRSNRPKAQGAMVFLEIDGESITRPRRDPDEEEGGEG
jgi:hypothetical protein